MLTIAFTGTLTALSFLAYAKAPCELTEYLAMWFVIIWVGLLLLALTNVLCLCLSFDLRAFGLIA